MTPNTFSVWRPRAATCYLTGMSFDQLHAFMTVAEEANLTRAAERMHISQPPLTRKIRGLEDELGTPLFLRGPNGMQLLPAGERLLVHARVILEAVEAAVSAVTSSTSDPISKLPASATDSPPVSRPGRRQSVRETLALGDRR